MKVVINKCFGGFGLSGLAVKRYAELKGRPCFFFSMRDDAGHLNMGIYRPISLEQAAKEFIICAFDIPNPGEVLTDTEEWHTMSMEDRQKANRLYQSHELPHGRELDRADADLITVVQELGDKANGPHAKLEIVEIPDGIEYEIDEYDGRESIHEVHRSWS